MNKKEFDSLCHSHIATSDLLDGLICLLIQKQVISFESISELITETVEDAHLHQPELSDAYNSQLQKLDVYRASDELRLTTQLMETIKQLNQVRSAKGAAPYKLHYPDS